MHASEFERFTELFDSWTQECNARFSQYAEDTAEIQGDLEVLGRLQAYLADNVATLEDYLLDRVNV
jgi:hypothetical protein